MPFPPKTGTNMLHPLPPQSLKFSVSIRDPAWCVWLSSVARLCATRDASNKHNVWKPTIPAGISRPPPFETISHVTRVPNHKTRLAGLKESFSAEGPCENVSSCIRWRSGAKNLEYRRRRRVTAGRTAGVTGPGAGAPTTKTSELALRTPSTGVEATPRRVTGSFWEREYDVPN